MEQYADIRLGMYSTPPIYKSAPLRTSLLTHTSQNRSSYDLKTLIAATTSNGMLLLYPEGSTEPQGHLMAAIYNNSTAWVALFVMTESQRGLGFGRVLFDACMAEFAARGIEHVGLDGVAQQKGTYERRAFVDSPMGLLRNMSRDLVAKSPLPSVTDRVEAGCKVVDIKIVPLGLTVKSDLGITGFERQQLWTKDFLARPDVYGFAVVTELPVTTVQQIEAWVVVRRCSLGFRIGPTYGQNVTAVKLALTAAMQKATPKLIQDIRLDKESISDESEEEIADKAELYAEVWGGNAKAVALFEELGWKLAGVDHHRMWLNNNPTKEQRTGGVAHKCMFSIFDAAIG